MEKILSIPFIIHIVLKSKIFNRVTIKERYDELISKNDKAQAVYLYKSVTIIVKGFLSPFLI